jgi:hypothetical protein
MMGESFPLNLMTEEITAAPEVVDAELQALISQAELAAETDRYISAATAKRAAQAEQEARDQALSGWIAAGMGALPLPASPAEFQELPMHIRMQLQARDLPLYELMAGPKQPLPAETEARLRSNQLTQADGPVLEGCGFLQEADALKERLLQERWSTFEAGNAARAEASQQQQAEWAAAQAAGQERFNAAAKAHYISRVHQGLPPAPMLR